MALTNGTYYISALTQGLFLEFATSAPGTNLTGWPFTGQQNQQWNVATDGSTYTFQNVLANNYIAFSGTQSGSNSWIFSSDIATKWFVEEFNGGFVFSLSPTFTTSWNLAGGFSDPNTNVINYPVDDKKSNSVWLLQSTSAPSASLTTSAVPAPTNGTSSDDSDGGGLSTSDKVALGTSLGVGIPTLIITAIGVWWSRNRGSKEVSKDEEYGEKGGL